MAYEKLKLVIAQPLLDLSQMIIFRAMEGKISLDTLSLFAIEEYFDIEPDDTNGVAAIYCDTIYQTIRKLYPHMLNAAKNTLKIQLKIAHTTYRVIFSCAICSTIF